MATDQPIISRFAGEIDRDYFGAWLSGFVDGEGCFMLLRHARPSGRIIRHARFLIALRQDDLPTLEAIQAYWGTGKIQVRKSYGNSQPQRFFAIWNRPILESVLIPHFGRYPLVAKKRRDYEIWKQGVAVLARVSKRPRRCRGYEGGIFPKWTDADGDEFDRLASLLTETRKFHPDPCPVIADKPCDCDRQSLLFD